MKKYIMEIAEEAQMFDTLQRYLLEKDARLAIIDRLFDTHRDDPDDSMFQSVPYKSYMKEFEELNAQYTEAMNEFSKYLMPVIQKKENNEDVSFRWSVVDFAARKCEITIMD